ncbi:MAG: SIR2 family protein, partial [Pyrinomonadaceae bacterium]
LYKMHGTFLEEDLGVPKQAKDVIITEEEYIQFLTIIGHPVKGVPGIIRAELQRSSLLFLGYSLEDWDFRAVFKGLIEALDEDEQRKSFAIQSKPSPFWVEFWKDKKVIIYDIDLYKFADELEKKCLEYEKEHPERQR